MITYLAWLALAAFSIIVLFAPKSAEKPAGQTPKNWLMTDLGSAQKEVWILVGCDRLINWADPKISSALKAMAARGVAINIVVGPKCFSPLRNTGLIKPLNQLAVRKRIRIYCPGETPIGTQWQVDNSMTSADSRAAIHYYQQAVSSLRPTLPGINIFA